jgi:hypothetical protein
VAVATVGLAGCGRGVGLDAAGALRWRSAPGTSSPAALPTARHARSRRSARPLAGTPPRRGRTTGVTPSRRRAVGLGMVPKTRHLDVDSTFCRGRVAKTDIYRRRSARRRERLALLGRASRPSRLLGLGTERRYEQAEGASKERLGRSTTTGSPQPSARAPPWDGKAERLRGLQVNHELELGGLLDGEVGKLGALEDAVEVRRPVPIHTRQIDPIAHEATGPHKVREPVHRRRSASRREGDDRRSLSQEHPILEHRECLHALLVQCSEGALDLFRIARPHGVKLHLECLGRDFHECEDPTTRATDLSFGPTAPPG